MAVLAVVLLVYSDVLMTRAAQLARTAILVLIGYLANPFLIFADVIFFDF